MQGGKLDTQGLADSITVVELFGLNRVKVPLANVGTNIANKIVRAPLLPNIFGQQQIPLKHSKTKIPWVQAPSPLSKYLKRASTYSVEICTTMMIKIEMLIVLKCLKLAGNEQRLAAADLDWTSAFIPGIDDVLVAKNKHYNYWLPARAVLPLSLISNLLIRLTARYLTTLTFVVLLQLFLLLFYLC